MSKLINLLIVLSLVSVLSSCSRDKNDGPADETASRSPGQSGPSDGSPASPSATPQPGASYPSYHCEAVIPTDEGRVTVCFDYSAKPGYTLNESIEREKCNEIEYEDGYESTEFGYSYCPGKANVVSDYCELDGAAATGRVFFLKRGAFAGASDDDIKQADRAFCNVFAANADTDVTVRWIGYRGFGFFDNEQQSNFVELIDLENTAKSVINKF